MLEDGAAARCAVTKDAGDDSDDRWHVGFALRCAAGPQAGFLLTAAGRRRPVTKAGLDQPVGERRSTMPRAMIEEQVRTVCTALGYSGGMDVVISIPGGAEVAARTFNPQAGYCGRAVDFGYLRYRRANERKCHCRHDCAELRSAFRCRCAGCDPDAGQLWPGFSAQPCAGAARRSVKCANFIGAALDGAVVAGFVRILLVGHRKAGETGRRRDEYPLPMPTAAWSCCAPMLQCAGDAALCRAVMEAPTTDAALEFLQGAGLQGAGAFAAAGHRRPRASPCGGGGRCGAVLFSINTALWAKARAHGRCWQRGNEKRNIYAVGVGPGDPNC